MEEFINAAVSAKAQAFVQRLLEMANIDMEMNTGV